MGQNPMHTESMLEFKPHFLWQGAYLIEGIDDIEEVYPGTPLIIDGYIEGFIMELDKRFIHLHVFGTVDETNFPFYALSFGSGNGSRLTIRKGDLWHDLLGRHYSPNYKTRAYATITGMDITKEWY